MEDPPAGKPRMGDVEVQIQHAKRSTRRRNDTNDDYTNENAAADSGEAQERLADHHRYKRKQRKSQSLDAYKQLAKLQQLLADGPTPCQGGVVHGSSRRCIA